MALASADTFPGERDWSVVKRSVVRVGVYSTVSQTLLTVGSGSIVRRPGSTDKFADHVLTAAHVLID